MVLNNVSQLKHIQLTKHMHYCIQKIYDVYYTTQWNSIILRKFSHMTFASPNEKWIRVADIVRRFCNFLLWRREFCFDVVGNLNLRKWLQTAMHWQNRLFLTFESLTIHCFFLTVKNNVIFEQKNMQWRHRSVRIALRHINKKCFEIGERQNRCHDDIYL